VTLAFELHLLSNPWPVTVPDLGELLERASRRRAASVSERHGDGEYARESLALVVLDPTAPCSRATEAAVLAVICIGPEGPRFAPNAFAKAAEHRDHGREAGALALAAKHRLADGDFRSGFSAEVAGTIVGGSGQNSLQDQYEATMLAAELNYEVAKRRVAWEERQGRGGWYTEDNVVGPRYREIWQSPAAEVRSGE
jgi:hypothetical protein